MEYLHTSHTADNVASVKTKLSKITDAAPSMITCTKPFHMRHVIYIAHVLNLIVRKSFHQVPALNNTCAKARKPVTFFRKSTPAKERLVQVQIQMVILTLKMIIEVDMC